MTDRLLTVAQYRALLAADTPPSAADNVMIVDSDAALGGLNLVEIAKFTDFHIDTVAHTDGTFGFPWSAAQAAEFAAATTVLKDDTRLLVKDTGEHVGELSRDTLALL